jgi:hypothetical protein
MRQWRLTAILLCVATCCLWGAQGALASDSSVRSAIESSARQIKEDRGQERDQKGLSTRESRECGDPRRRDATGREKN